VTAPDDAKQVMSALRLGWYLAEVRGRNRPGGPPGSSARMPDHNDDALPLRNERSPTELRIEAQSVIAALAKVLEVDDAGDGVSFGAAIDDQSKLLAHVRAPKAALALQQGIDMLAKAPASQAVELLQQALTGQQKVVKQRQQAVANAQQALASAQQQQANAQQQAEAKSAAEATVKAADATVKLEQATADGEQIGLVMLQDAITALQRTPADQADPAPAEQAGPATAEQANPAPAGQADPAPAGPAGLAALQTGLRTITKAAGKAWKDLAKLLWRFDAHIQDVLAAAADRQAVGYQLGRGLAETYWALDPAQEDGSTGWSFLLGQERCDELGRLVGRLGAYMGPYTAPAVAGTIVIWRSVAENKDQQWRGAGQDALDAAQQALYRQTRRWYELIVLAQDPTTLIKPYQLVFQYRTVLRALGAFWPQLVATVVGLVFLGFLLFLLSSNSTSTWKQSVSGILAAVGLSFAGLTGTLKSSALAMLTRLRQDAYTDLVTLAVQTTPPPKNARKKKSLLQQAIDRRRLTPATPN
jgi:hypothetical protein